MTGNPQEQKQIFVPSNYRGGITIGEDAAQGPAYRSLSSIPKLWTYAARPGPLSSHALRVSRSVGPERRVYLRLSVERKNTLRVRGYPARIITKLAKYAPGWQGQGPQASKMTRSCSITRYRGELKPRSIRRQAAGDGQTISASQVSRRPTCFLVWRLPCVGCLAVEPLQDRSASPAL